MPPNDAAALAAAWERLADDPALRMRLAQSSRERAPEFGVDRSVEVLESAYDEVARSTPAPSPGVGTPQHAGPDSRPRLPPLDIRPATFEDRAGDSSRSSTVRSTTMTIPRGPALFAWKHDAQPFRAVADVGGDRWRSDRCVPRASCAGSSSVGERCCGRCEQSTRRPIPTIRAAVCSRR